MECIEVNKGTLAFAPIHNTKGRKDADEFKRQAGYFLKHHDLPAGNLILIDNKKNASGMRAQVYDGLRRDNPYSQGLVGVCFFCHGFKSGIQFGFRNAQADDLADAIASFAGQAPRVPLYACDTGRDSDRDRTDDLSAIGGDGGFADRLRDALCEPTINAIRCVVDAHTTAGHTTRNPHVRRFEGSVGGGKGGFYIVSRNSKLWSTWRKQLKTTFRFDFPFMSVDAIHYYLNKHK